jgi:iron complex transport system substrate-binding protein
MDKRARKSQIAVLGTLALAFCASFLLWNYGRYWSTSNGGAESHYLAVPESSNAGVPAVQYAKGFTLERRGRYSIIRVLSPWRNSKTGFVYILAPRGSAIPQMEPGAVFVETPVQRIVLTSTTHVPYLAMLGLEDAIVGVVGGKMISTASVAERIGNGQIAEVGDGSDMVKGFNMERLISVRPDLVMTYGTGNPQFDHHAQLLEAGFRVAMNAEYMETNPLGRTEWMKFIAAFFEKDADAERLFADIAARYEDQAAKARAVTERPKVFCGSSFRGVWHMPGGNSFVAAFLRDSGADYVWKDDGTTGSIPLNAEAVIARAKSADIWLNPGTSRSLEELAGEDERYALFRAFQTGRVYNNNAKMDAGGGNDIWETGVANPDRVLSDLISLLHPDLLPNYQRTWYWQLPERSPKPK